MKEVETTAPYSAALFVVSPCRVQGDIAEEQPATTNFSANDCLLIGNRTRVAGQIGYCIAVSYT